MKNMTQPIKIKLRKGDKVIVISGKYKGKVAKITAVHPKLNKVTVEGVNVYKRHLKANRSSSGGIVDIIKPIWVSKVALYDSTTKKASRIHYKVNDDGHKIRLYSKSGKEVTNND